ncbi:CsgG/HfaB family protein [Natroniella acetigena]|uniref:CsgG/HfaB family protein n=1 Tax=Natroniella acetigena TaxID=52004 RepID=UPI00200B2B5D|nr:CsgG/HfaB family protein [Natroniella acetigena]MCK8828494.1 CsgG/HfaB family protein [Natroniella acetigena]
MNQEAGKDFLGDYLLKGGDSLITILLALLIVFVISTPGFAENGVAVLEFGGEGSNQYRQAASNYLTQILIDLDRMDVISRNEIVRILDEQRFQMSGFVDGDAGGEAGNVLGVDRIFVGNIDRLTTSGSWSDYDGEARVTVQLIDVETGTVLQSFQSEGSSSSEDNRTSARNEALESAINDLSNPIREVFAITSFVTNVSRDNVDLLGGTEMGIRSGYRYYVMRQDEAGFDSKIGMLEIEQVTADNSRAKILWQEEPIEEYDTVEEVPYNRQKMTAIGFSPRTYSFDGDSEMIPTLEFRGIMERVFESERAVILSGGYDGDVTMLGLGIEGTYEKALTPGGLYLVGSAGAGFNVAWQSYDSGRASASGFYGNLGTGLKYYSDYDQGFRIRAGLQGQLGSTIDSWEDTDSGDSVDDGIHSEIGLSGIGFNIIATMPVDIL